MGKPSETNLNKNAPSEKEVKENTDKGEPKKDN